MSIHTGFIINNIAPFLGLSRYPPTDILEVSEKFIMEVHLPGYNKNNINIGLNGTHTLVLSGHIHDDRNELEEAHAQELREEARKTEEAQAQLSRELDLQGQSDKLQEKVQEESSKMAGDKKTQEKSMVDKAKEFIASQEKKIEALLRKNEEDNQKTKIHYMLKERNVPESFSRVYSFHSNINPEGIKVSFKDGILMIHIPKMNVTQRININFLD